MAVSNQTPAVRSAPPGFERILLRRLPAAGLFGSVVAAIPSLFTRLLAWTGLDTDATTRILTADIFGLSTLLLLWATIVTLATGAVILTVMKGPAYYADSYPLDDADRPDGP
ncbi:hypothetical protein [Aromatoleum diolicum]|uniref:Transmembrane protein n=1 Tax=Aromatoleum diolicum TaxID=75796 RepID=A0ABX1QCJ8_9RHOO|nr:hypothetical protein [Aromatoleum diolicum]NMG74741.1 hypothetical protein [Aromatoleum diolicum]